MCGIVGYVGQRPARGVVVDALRRMEYRGYDSAGIALVDGSPVSQFMVAWYFLPLNVPSPLSFVATKHSKTVVLAVK